MTIFGDPCIYLMHVNPEPLNVIAYRGSNRGNITDNARNLSASFHTSISIQARTEAYFDNEDLALLCGGFSSALCSCASDGTYLAVTVKHFDSI